MTLALFTLLFVTAGLTVALRWHAAQQTRKALATYRPVYRR